MGINEVISAGSGVLDFNRGVLLNLLDRNGVEGEGLEKFHFTSDLAKYR
jgi:hypothetical protein